MPVLKYKDANGDYHEIIGIIIHNDVVQDPGDSTTYVMSQNAVTDYVISYVNGATVISEPIAELYGNLSSLVSSRDTMGEADIYGANFTEMPQYRGGALVVQGDHAPSSTNYYVDQYGSYSDVETAYMHAPDYINHPGQIWVYDTNAWMGLQAGTATWKQISLS